MDLVSIALRLKHHPAGYLTFSDARFALTAIMNSITNKAKRAIRALHDTQGCRPVATAILPSKHTYTLLRLTFVHPAALHYVNLLTSQWVVHPSLRLGGLDCEIDGIEINIQSWAGIQSWEGLNKGEPVSGKFTLEFYTPTTIDKLGRPTDLLPDPQCVFGSLASKWQLLGGPTLPQNVSRYIRTGGCIVSDYEIETVTFNLGEYMQISSKSNVASGPFMRQQKGFKGKVTYTLREDDQDCVYSIFSLARFAVYSGVGHHTNQGMGAVRVCDGSVAYT